MAAFDCIQKSHLEIMFDAYQACSSVSSAGLITQYHTVSNVADCFLKQFDRLSQLVANTCIAQKSRTPFLNCMNMKKEGFLPSVQETYKKATLFFNDDTLGTAFFKELELCARQVELIEEL